MRRHYPAIFLLFALLSCDDENNTEQVFELASLNGDYKGPCVVSTSYTSGDVLYDTFDVTIAAVAHETRDSIMYLTIEEFSYVDMRINFLEGPETRRFRIYETAYGFFDPSGTGSFPADSLRLNVFQRVNSTITKRIACNCKKSND